MKRKIIVAVISAVLALPAALPALAAPTEISISVPLQFGGHREHRAEPVASAAQVRIEKRLRLARYGMQLADAIISAIGYHAYSRCLTCLAFPGGGPRGGLTASMADFNGNRPAEVDPLIQPFSRGGFVSLGLGTLAFDLIDSRVERHWSVRRRSAADLAEIGAHAWGISTWLPEIRTIDHATALASACGAQWRAKQFGQAFSDGCVNQFYRADPRPANAPVAGNVMTVCAPGQFKSGTYLFTTPTQYIVASGTPCANPTVPWH